MIEFKMIYIFYDMLCFFKLKVPLQVPLKILVKVRVKVRTWSGQVRSPTPKWDLSYTLKLVSTHHHHTISK